MLPLIGAVVLAAAPGPEDSAKLSLMSEGAMSKIGYYMPQRVKLAADKPESIKKVPDGLTAPLYGIIEIRGRENAKHHVIVDEPEGKPAQLFIDVNGDGDLTNDAPAKWEGRPVGKPHGPQFTQYAGAGKLSLGDSYDVAISFYRFDKNDPGRAALKDVLLYYRDYAVSGEMTLAGKTYNVLLNDNAASGDFRGKPLSENPGEKETSGVQLMIDVNGNGKFDKRGEAFDVRKPFNIGGTTYELADIAPTGLQVRVARSAKTVPEVPLAPDHSLGKKITPFEAKSTDGKTVQFPGDYKGKIVMIDFWATWCGPCMREIPGLVETYNKFNAQGFEVLGVSLDDAKTIEKLKPVTEEKGMKWTQICDGQGWKAALAQLYVVEGIPACWLVDGDTGEILAIEQDLRGAKLRETIERALSRKKGT